MKRLPEALFLIFLLAGCFKIPISYNPYMFEKFERQGGLEIYHLPAPERNDQWDEDGYEEACCYPKKNLNLLFVAADATIQKQFEQQIADEWGITSRVPSLEEAVWWKYSELLGQTYRKIVRIPPEMLTFKNLQSGMELLENDGRPYDVILLTHGFHNHLTDGRSGYFLSYQELEVWKGRFANLNMVFLQGCFSSTLSGDWMQAGAKYVLSYEGLNRNFFYLEPFLYWYRHTQYTLPEIVETKLTRQDIQSRLESDLLYPEIIRRMKLGDNVSDYLDKVPWPLFEQALPNP